MAKGTINKVIILGRLGNDPEVRTTQNGTTVATLSIATNDGYGDNLTTEWHRVVVFGKGAEAIQKYTKKGSQLFIEGRLRTSKYQDKNGNTQYSTDIIASSFEFINGDNQNQSNNHNSKIDTPNVPKFNPNNFDDNIPF